MRTTYWLGLAGALATGLALAGGCAKDDEAQPGAGGAVACEKAPAGSPHNAEAGCDLRCPGDASCKASDDPTFYAGAAKEDISPVVDHVVAWAPGNENNSDFKPLTGDKCVAKACIATAAKPYDCPAVDALKCTWMAGFGIGRPAVDVVDPITVRCIVMKQGNTKVGLCAVDVIGWFYNEVERTRELIASDYPELQDLDLVEVGATHVHDMKDVMGQYGPVDGQSGVDKPYNAMIRQKTAEALKKANAALTPVKLEFGASLVDGHISATDPGGHKTAAFVTDVRDPVVLDHELRTVRFVSSQDDTTVATLLNFCGHPEIADDRNFHISADYVHTLRDGVEQGLDVKASDGSSLYKAPGFGGVAVFFNGALGGQVGPGLLKHVDFDGSEIPEDRAIDRAYSNGRKLAAYALEAMSRDVTRLETAPLGFRARKIYGDVKNGQFHIAIAQQIFDRDGEFYDRTLPLGDDNIPSIRTQVFVLDVGPAELVSVPGELHAELLLATRQGVISTEAPYPFTPAPFHILNDPETNPTCTWNAEHTGCSCADGYSRCDNGVPAIAKLDRNMVIDLHRDPKATFRWVLGLTPDELGYIVPEYDYKLDAQNPYFTEAAPGDHYEETNSIGVDVQAHLVGPILQLLDSQRVVTR